MTHTDAGHCRLYVRLAPGPTAAARLSAALAAADVASCLLLADPGTPLSERAAKPLVALAQRQGAAVLIDGDIALARALRADGVHLTPPATADDEDTSLYDAARRTLGEDAIIGVDPGISRHAAMSLAEAGASYVAFGAPPHLQDQDKARARRDDLIGWWAEVIEVPCVALDVETAAEAAALAQAGADFVGIDLPETLSPDQTGALVAGFAAALAGATVG